MIRHYRTAAIERALPCCICPIMPPVMVNPHITHYYTLRLNIPCWRTCQRIYRLLYPLWPTIRWGRCLGRPHPFRLTAPLAMRYGKTTASWRWPVVKIRVSSVPPHRPGGGP